jgi:hypothetical protein
MPKFKGRSHFSQYLNIWQAMTVKPKITWQRLPGLRLQASTDSLGPRGLNESDMDPVQAWTEECHCGTRTSFDTWRFKNEGQITMFLIRWTE